MVEETLNPEKLPPEEISPWQNMQCNYSALLYIITEQQALLGLLLEELLKSQTIDTAQVTRITGVYGNPDVLNPTYEDIHKRYTSYYLSVRALIKEQQQAETETKPKSVDLE